MDVFTSWKLSNKIMKNYNPCVIDIYFYFVYWFLCFNLYSLCWRFQCCDKVGSVARRHITKVNMTTLKPSGNWGHGPPWLSNVCWFWIKIWERIWLFQLQLLPLTGLQHLGMSPRILTSYTLIQIRSHDNWYSNLSNLRSVFHWLDSCI